MAYMHKDDNTPFRTQCPELSLFFQHHCSSAFTLVLQQKKYFFQLTQQQQKYNSPAFPPIFSRILVNRAKKKSTYLRTFFPKRTKNHGGQVLESNSTRKRHGDDQHEGWKRCTMDSYVKMITGMIRLNVNYKKKSHLFSTIQPLLWQRNERKRSTEHFFFSITRAVRENTEVFYPSIVIKDFCCQTGLKWTVFSLVVVPVWKSYFLSLVWWCLFVVVVVLLSCVECLEASHQPA